MVLGHCCVVPWGIHKEEVPWQLVPTAKPGRSPACEFLGPSHPSLMNFQINLTT